MSSWPRDRLELADLTERIYDRAIDVQRAQEAARQRQFELAHWSDSTAEATVQGAQRVYRPSPRGCPFPGLCSRTGMCERVVARVWRIARARAAIAYMRATWSAEYPRN